VDRAWLGEPRRSTQASEKCLVVDRLRADTVLLHLFGLPARAKLLERLPEPAAPTKLPQPAGPPAPPINLPQSLPSIPAPEPSPPSP
jgi:hypothetical protein